MKSGELPFHNVEKAHSFRIAKLYRRSSGMSTSIRRKLVSFCPKSGWEGRCLCGRQPPRKEQKVIMGYVSLTIYREFPASKFLRALPYRACGTRCSGPLGYFPRLAISSSAFRALLKVVFVPFQHTENQRSRRAEITFETF